MHAILLLCALLVGGIPSTQAQDPDAQMFSWGFSGTQAVSQSLPSCRSFPIQVTPMVEHGVPPYYMMAFAVGGEAITSYIGKDANNLTWTVTHPVGKPFNLPNFPALRPDAIGTQLLLGVVDSRGVSGGVDPPMYTVTAGTSTQCIPTPAAEPAFTVTANVTDVLTTCQPWGLTIRGGTPPYTVSLPALNASVVANSTLGANDSVFTFVNRADPGTQLLAAVSDLNGRWATGSPLVRTQGSANVDCPGQVDTSGSSNSTSTSQGPAQTTTSTSPSRSMSRKRIATIAVTSAAGLLLVSALILWALQRRRRLRRARDSSTTILPFETYSSDEPRFVTRPRGFIPAVHQSKVVAQAGSHHTVPLHTTSPTELTALTSPSAASPTSSPPPLRRIRELPPPYADPGMYEGGQ